MAEIKKYTKKDGSTAYQFSVYLGINPKTGKQRRTTRRGFESPKEARMALARIELGVDKPKRKNEIKKKYVTFAELYEMWLETYSYTVKETTLEKTKLYFRVHILPELGNYVITEIDFEICQNIVNKWARTSAVFRNSFLSN